MTELGSESSTASLRLWRPGNAGISAVCGLPDCTSARRSTVPGRQAASLGGVDGYLKTVSTPRDILKDQPPLTSTKTSGCEGPQREVAFRINILKCVDSNSTLRSIPCMQQENSVPYGSLPGRWEIADIPLNEAFIRDTFFPPCPYLRPFSQWVILQNTGPGANIPRHRSPLTGRTRRQQSRRSDFCLIRPPRAGLYDPF